MAAAQEFDPIVPKERLGDMPSEIRSNFIVKVYAILCVQLSVTAVVAAPFKFIPAVKTFVTTPGYGTAFMIGLVVIQVVLLCTMCCYPALMRAFPKNYAMLFAFTITEGAVVGVIIVHYTLNSVLAAVVATALLVGGLSVYAATTKSDFTTFGPYLFCVGMVFFFFLIGVSFFSFPFKQQIIGCIGILLFSMYLIYDTQLVMGNKELSMGIDEYCFAALNLYIDIIQIFLYILQAFGIRD
mmetsp:Transcript_8610/g.23999  ORF Transcript_8610/g.23999 Transcript_8610/m.23999 type:complete len:240 (-) Transcript_8610:86-805(-)